MTDHELEQELQAKGLTAPRVTPGRIEAAIVQEDYFTAADGVIGAHSYERSQGWQEGDLMPMEVLQVIEPLTTLTFCVLTLRSGYTVTGESACASPENFNREIGRKIARLNAVQKIWPLEGYLLKNHISRHVA